MNSFEKSLQLLTSYLVALDAKVEDSYPGEVKINFKGYDFLFHSDSEGIGTCAVCLLDDFYFEVGDDITKLENFHEVCTILLAVFIVKTLKAFRQKLLIFSDSERNDAIYSYIEDALKIVKKLPFEKRIELDIFPTSDNLSTMKFVRIYNLEKSEDIKTFPFN